MAEPNPFMPPAPSSIPRWALRFVIFMVLLAAYGIYRFFHPYNDVGVVVRNLPPDTTFACLLADSPTERTAMPVSRSKLFPFTIDPFHGGDVTQGQTTYDETVRWISAPQVGVLRETAGGVWEAGWYQSPKSDLTSRPFLLLFGQGTWHVDWNDADSVQPISAAELQRL